MQERIVHKGHFKPIRLQQLEYLFLSVSCGSSLSFHIILIHRTNSFPLSTWKRMSEINVLCSWFFSELSYCKCRTGGRPEYAVSIVHFEFVICLFPSFQNELNITFRSVIPYEAKIPPTILIRRIEIFIEFKRFPRKLIKTVEKIEIFPVVFISIHHMSQVKIKFHWDKP